MGDRGALDRFTIELYKTAKEMSIENSKSRSLLQTDTQRGTIDLKKYVEEILS